MSSVSSQRRLPSTAEIALWARGLVRLAREAPESLWAGAEQVVIDEVQREPELLSAIKLAVDRHPRRLRFT